MNCSLKLEVVTEEIISGSIEGYINRILGVYTVAGFLVTQLKFFNSNPVIHGYRLWQGKLRIQLTQLILGCC